MMEPRETSLGSQIDELVAHVIERIDRLDVGVSQNNANAEELHLKIVRLATSVAALSAIVGAYIGGSLGARLLW